MAHHVYLSEVGPVVPPTIKLTVPKDRGIELALADLRSISTTFKVVDKNNALLFNPGEIRLKGGGERAYLILKDPIPVPKAIIEFSHDDPKTKEHSDLHVEC